MRKYNISATVILQDKAQIEAMYQDEWRTLLANCCSWIVLGSSELDSLKYFSEKLGSQTITSKNRSVSRGGKSSESKSFQQMKRDVLTAEELGRLPADECIVFTQGMRPVHDKKFAYEKHLLYPETQDADPANAFLYKNNPYYDNSRPLHINSLLKAMVETNRLMKEGIVTKPLDPQKEHFRGSAEDILNTVTCNQKTEDKTFSYWLTACAAPIMAHINDPIICIDVQSIPAKHVQKLLVNSFNAYTYNKPIVFFNDIGSADNRIAVTAYTDECEFEKLTTCMNNALSSNFNISDNTTPYHFISLYLSRSAVEEYKAMILSSYCSF